MICAVDSPGPGVRSGTFADYKANRTEIPVDLAPQIPLILQVIEGYGTPALLYPGWEADDVIATVVRKATQHGLEVRIVTSDKDVRQLLGPQVQIYNVRKNAFYDENSLQQDWGIRPDQVVDFQALVGDSVDNVPGVPLVGPKKASALLQQFGTLEEVLANADKARGGPKLRENLKAFADQARMSRQLVELNVNLPITVDWDAARVKEPDRPRLHAIFTELGFRRFADEMRTRTLLPEQPSANREPTAQPTAPAEPAETSLSVPSPPAPVPASPMAGLDDAAKRRGHQIVDTEEMFEQFVNELRAAKKNLCRLGDDQPRRRSSRHRRLGFQLAAGDGLLPPRPRTRRPADVRSRARFEPAQAAAGESGRRNHQSEHQVRHARPSPGWA